MTDTRTAAPFRLDGALLPSPLGRRLESLLEKASGLDKLQRIYDRLPRGLTPVEFLDQGLALLGVQPALADDEAAHVPRSGGAVVVANHPFGVLDGCVLARVLLALRPDVRILANGLLGRVPELSPLFIGVDPFGGANAARRNLLPLREAIRWVDGGGLLLVFPAGEVAHLQPRMRAITDPEWNPAVARIVARTGAPVVPAYIPGRNSAGFQLAGLVHPRLRTALLPREACNKPRGKVLVRMGHPLSPERTAGLPNHDLLALLRLRCYALAERPASLSASQTTELEPVAPPQDPAALASEVATLPASARLADSGPLVVYCARARRIPHLLQEIGRLREITFRATGEGTGKSRDLDLFDNYYLHLFIWNEAAQELVGAYRLGQADRILARYGRRGLYTQSLFRFGRRLLDELNPALELGRSFIRPEYQRSYAPLLLLWKGIGAYVATHPRYRVLFGPVSISAEYQTASRQLLVDFLSANNRLPELARMVRPRRRFKGLARHRRVELTPPESPEQVSKLLEHMEQDGKGMPVLLRQYLKLGGRILGFNVDPDFANALDGLIMVDLTRTEPKVLARYMGAEGLLRFQAYHASQEHERAG